MMLHRCCTTAWLFVGAVLLAGCSKGPQPGAVLDEAKLAGRDGGVVPACRGGLLPRHGRRRRARRRRRSRAATCGWSGAAATTASGPDDRLHLRCLRPAEGRQLASQPRLFARQPLGLLRPGQRALLRARRPAPTRTAAACGSTCAARTARPIPSRTRASTRAWRSARAASRWATAPRSRSARSTARAPASPACACFPNPAFDEKAAKAWDAEKYYTDPSYYNRKDLVRPYRVGMSCGFCHVGPSPVKPPADPEQPEVREPQLLGRRAVHVGGPALHLQRRTSPRAARTTCTSSPIPTGRARMDTSLVSTDSINNPRTMNAVYDVRRRAWKWPSASGRKSSAAASSTTSSSTTS